MCWPSTMALCHHDHDAARRFPAGGLVDWHHRSTTRLQGHWLGRIWHTATWAPRCCVQQRCPALLDVGWFKMGQILALVGSISTKKMWFLLTHISDIKYVNRVNPLWTVATYCCSAVSTVVDHHYSDSKHHLLGSPTSKHLSDLQNSLGETGPPMEGSGYRLPLFDWQMGLSQASLGTPKLWKLV